VAASISPRAMSISSASVTVTESPVSAKVELAARPDDHPDLRALPGGERSDLVARPDAATDTGSAKRKSRLGRLPHWTGIRNGHPERSSPTSTISRCSSK
jgi:hypothetical protein